MDYFIIKNIFYFIISLNLSITISYMILSAMQTYHMNKNNKVDTHQNNNWAYDGQHLQLWRESG